MTEKSFIMMCGLPGSGKSTIARKLADEKSIWLSSDEIRKELYGSEASQGDNERVFGLMNERTSDYLSEGKNVIYDATNINSSRRKSLLDELSCHKICIVCATPYEECLRRNELRERVVPVDAIRSMYERWNPPAYFEGWDEIRIIHADGTRGYLGKPMEYAESLMTYEQDSRYHGETLGEHLLMTASYLKETYGFEEDSLMFKAGLIHDCGKPFSRTVDETGEAHYQSHWSTGSYDSMFFDLGDATGDEILKISILIYLHMAPFSWKLEKTREKYRKLWGDELFKEVLMLHEADEKSSCKK